MIIAIFTTASKWNQPRKPSTDKRLKKSWYEYAMECYVAIKENEVTAFEGKEMHERSLCKLSWTRKDKCHKLSLSDLEPRFKCVYLGHGRRKGLGQRKREG